MTYKELESKLIASQLREKALREALEEIKSNAGKPELVYWAVKSALALPTDTTEADALLARVMAEVERLTRRVAALDTENAWNKSIRNSYE